MGLLLRLLWSLPPLLSNYTTWTTMKESPAFEIYSKGTYFCGWQSLWRLSGTGARSFIIHWKPSCDIPTNCNQNRFISLHAVRVHRIDPDYYRKHLVWDATSPNIFAPSYLQSATSTAGAVATLAKNRKKDKYGCLDSAYSFTPIDVESSGACGPLTLWFLRA